MTLFEGEPRDAVVLCLPGVSQVRLFGLCGLSCVGRSVRSITKHEQKGAKTLSWHSYVSKWHLLGAQFSHESFRVLEFVD